MSAREAYGIPGAQDERIACVERARAGDRQAFGELIQTFQEDIFRMVYYRTGSDMDAEDLTQEIFIKAFDRLAGLKDPALFRPWLYRIAVNRVNDHHRRKRLRAFFTSGTDADVSEREDLRQEGVDALDHVMKKEFWRQVEMFMQRLSHQEREVFQLRFMDHLGIAEISAVLGKNESTIKTHLYRAVRKFQGESPLLELIRGAVS